MTFSWDFELKGFHWQQDLSWIPTFVLCNTILQLPVWYLSGRKDQWNFIVELLVVHFNFSVCICLGILLDILLNYSNHVESLVEKGVLYFIAFFSAHIIALVWAEIIVKIIARDIPTFSPRVKEPSIFYVVYQEILQALVDGFGYVCLLFICPFDLYTDQGQTPSFLEMLIGTVVMCAIPDLVFYVCHGLILHGPLWFAHRAHHTIYHPTVKSARKFDPLDWFLEASVAVTAASVFLNWVVLKASGNYARFLMHAGLGNPLMVSMIHHCGKNVPNPLTNLVPVFELLPLMCGTTIIELHEGHHNWVSKNFGVFGFWDYLFGTLKPPKMSVTEEESASKPKRS